MVNLNVELTEAQVEALRRYAAQRRMPVAWLVRNYVDYLIAGGEPIGATSRDYGLNLELAEAAQAGGSFDWLVDEPDLYSMEDGDTV